MLNVVLFTSIKQKKNVCMSWRKRNSYRPVNSVACYCILYLVTTYKKKLCNLSLSKRSFYVDFLFCFFSICTISPLICWSSMWSTNMNKSVKFLCNIFCCICYMLFVFKAVVNILLHMWNPFCKLHANCKRLYKIVRASDWCSIKKNDKFSFKICVCVFLYYFFYFENAFSASIGSKNSNRLFAYLNVIGAIVTNRWRFFFLPMLIKWYKQPSPYVIYAHNQLQNST